WNDLPNIRNEIDQMLPIIREKHWTEWGIASTNSKIYFGTRDFNDKGYLFVANEEESTQIVTFTLSNFPYIPTQVIDYFTNSPITAIEENCFTLSLPPFGTGCVYLQK
ncbi:hypothetical protein EH221_00565, partial [bacterium]